MVMSNFRKANSWLEYGQSYIEKMSFHYRAALLNSDFCGRDEL